MHPRATGAGRDGVNDIATAGLLLVEDPPAGNRVPAVVREGCQAMEGTPFACPVLEADTQRGCGGYNEHAPSTGVAGAGPGPGKRGPPSRKVRYAAFFPRNACSFHFQATFHAWTANQQMALATIQGSLPRAANSTG